MPALESKSTFFCIWTDTYKADSMFMFMLLATNIVPFVFFFFLG